MICYLFCPLFCAINLVSFFFTANGLLLIGTSVAVLYALHIWAIGGRCYSKARLDGKTAIITGANSGIGKETARDFIRRGARVIIACRDTRKGEMAAAEVRVCASKNGQVVVKEMDLASLKSVKKFCEDIIETENEINILVNNAGVMMCPEWQTEDGLEMQIGTNHFGHFLLTKLLLEKMKTSAPARIVNVSSMAYQLSDMNFDNINLKGEYNPNKAYGQSKLANILFTRELAKRLKGTNISTFVLHPGVVISNLGHHLLKRMPWLKYALHPPSIVLYKTAEQGAQTSIYCSVQEDIEHHSGSYFKDCQIASLKPEATDDDAAKKLWEISEEIVKKYL